jgi:hypothetical protein
MSGEHQDTQPRVEQSTLDDRRRPDRANAVSPELLPLLRSEPRNAAGGSVSISATSPDADDPLRVQEDPIRGISIALALAIPAWILIVLGVLIFVIPWYR